MKSWHAMNAKRARKRRIPRTKLDLPPVMTVEVNGVPVTMYPNRRRSVYRSERQYFNGAEFTVECDPRRMLPRGIEPGSRILSMLGRVTLTDGSHSPVATNPNSSSSARS